uniref:ARMD3 protein n=1 Tax=Pelodiscus sinensis TaxID=13735 RepID=K7FR27_PELSI
MAQAEKKGGLLWKSSASKKPLKEKVVLMYDEIFLVRTGPLPLHGVARFGPRGLGGAPRAGRAMAQAEKKGGLLWKSSASKKPLKEKVVLMYDEIFLTEDPSKCSPRFWEELFLMKVNLEYLESKLESLDGEELMKIKENINCLFQHCIQALGEEHPIRVVNALQVPARRAGEAGGEHPIPVVNVLQVPARRAGEAGGEHPIPVV